MSRTVIVGDVHGCIAELDELLGKVGLGDDDRLVLVGDVVARGPASRAVLSRLRELGASAVLGNHEARILAARDARARGEPGPRLGPSHARLLEEMDEADWAMLDALPLYRALPEHRVLVVHAGLVVGLPMEQQDPWALVHMRSLTADGRPTDRPGARSWAADYDGPEHVVFGHDARRGLQLHPRATGLDSGCVYGGRLSALVLPDGQAPAPPRERPSAIVSVPARAAYVSH